MMGIGHSYVAILGFINAGAIEDLKFAVTLNWLMQWLCGS